MRPVSGDVTVLRGRKSAEHSGQDTKERRLSDRKRAGNGLQGADDDTVFNEAQKRHAVLVTGDEDFANVRRFPTGNPSRNHRRANAGHEGTTHCFVDECPSTTLGSVAARGFSRRGVRAAEGETVRRAIS